MPSRPISNSTRDAPSGRPRPRKSGASAPTCWVTVRLKRRIWAIGSTISDFSQRFSKRQPGTRYDAIGHDVSVMSSDLVDADVSVNYDLETWRKPLQGQGNG